MLILFLLALILAFVHFAQERSTLRAESSNERFPEPAISKFFLASAGSAVLWFVVRMYVGSEWFLAGWEKVNSPAWGTSGKAITGFVNGALAKTSGPNPAVQGWYAWFLQHIVLPNAGLFSFLVTWGEVAVGVGLLLGILTGIAAGFGVLMNLNYLLAGTVSVNPVLGTLGFIPGTLLEGLRLDRPGSLVAPRVRLAVEARDLIPRTRNHSSLNKSLFRQ